MSGWHNWPRWCWAGYPVLVDATFLNPATRTQFSGTGAGVAGALPHSGFEAPLACCASACRRASARAKMRQKPMWRCWIAMALPAAQNAR